MEIKKDNQIEIKIDIKYNDILDKHVLVQYVIIIS